MNRKVVSIMLTVALSFSLALTNFTKERVEAYERGRFNVLSLNVAGLPEVLSSSNPKENTLQMSPLLNGYDIVSIQEDFAYHDDLIKYDTHLYKTESSGNVPKGDGMNFMSKFYMSNITRKTWNKRHGFIVDGSDEMTPKGILYSSMEIEPGYFIDVYDIHADADIDEKSLEARRDNMNQLAELIKEKSKGKAVIVIEDTNSRYTRGGDNFEEAVLKECNLTDAWIKLVRKGDIPKDGDALIDRENPNSKDNEVVDKIWYRSGENIDLSAISYDLITDKFKNNNGEQLSDHYPITAEFTYTLKDNMKMSDVFGGNGGYGFSFLEDIKGRFPTSVSINTGNRLDKITFNYGDRSLSAGGNGGDFKELKLYDGEFINLMELSKNKKSGKGSYRVSYVKLTTNYGRVLEGGVRGETVTYNAPSGYAIAGVYGNAADEVDSLGAIYMNKSIHK